MKLFDKYKSSKKIVLSNGKEVVQPISKAPLVILLLVLASILAIKITGFDGAILVKRMRYFWDIVQQMYPFFGEDSISLSVYIADLSKYINYILGPLFDTIKMSLLGSFLGSVAAVPLAICASTNVVKNKIVIGVVRLFLSIVRTVPTLVCALIATYIFGLGTLAGATAIFIFTFAYVGKILYEQIETVEMGSFEAMEAMGCTKLEAFRFAILPQVLPSFLSTSLFCFEGNVRYASILGYVGAGGLGLILNEKLGWRDYYSAGMILLVLFVTVFVIEQISQYLRKRLI